MTNQEWEYNLLLDKIADEINISDAMRDKAVSSYQAVGKWIGDGMDWDVEIMPQGSMNLGTIIRPITDFDDGYDMDLVCLLKNGYVLSLKDIKNLVGNRLKENLIYKDKLDDEGKRCWTLNYNGFHMDILPCVPKNIVFNKPENTEIKLTHKNENHMYEPRYSDPFKYHNWFEERMKSVLNIAKGAYATRNQVEIDTVPTYKVRTPLQKAIQLLKRHRDICFQDKDDAPISIILTTLAAQAYNGENNIYEALCHILTKMPIYIENRVGVYWIENPVMPEENFADKWNENSNKKDAFYSWLSQAKKDIITMPLSKRGLDVISPMLKETLGEAPVKRAMIKMANSMRDNCLKSNLYAKGLTGGLTTHAGISSMPIQPHTFYGK